MFKENALQQKFSWQSLYLWLPLFFFLLLRLWWASAFPMMNDEVYYWDWSRHLQLSYLDAPPFVAWISYAGQYFAGGVLGPRLLLPFLHLFSVLFLIASMEIINNSSLKIKHILSLLLLTEITPVFNLEGIALIPDGPLLFGISGALYYCLKAIEPTRSPLQLKYALGLGFFLGLAALAKYHALPIAVGFFLAICMLRGKAALKKDILFWLIVALVSLLVASPVFIWNFLNDFASFRFQSEHGYSGMSLDIKAFSRYVMGVCFYLFPWISIPLILFVLKKIRHEFFTIHLVYILPFLILFSLILFSALGKQALPHWPMPGFYLLLPGFALQLEKFFQKSRRLSLVTLVTSVVLSVGLPSLLCSKNFQKFILKKMVYFTGDASPLAQVFMWENLQKDLFLQHGIQITSQKYQSTGPLCPLTQPILASLRWYWTAQMAFYFSHQPRVYNFDLNNSSFYSWRDSFSQLENCPVIVIGSRGQFDKEKLMQIMKINSVKELTLFPYRQVDMVIVTGVMRAENKWPGRRDSNTRPSD